MLRKIGLSIAGLAWIAASGLAHAQAPPLAPKVLVITMFGGEAKPWLEGEALTRGLRQRCAGVIVLAARLQCCA